MVHFTIKVAKYQAAQDLYFVIENPAASQLWSLPEMQDLACLQDACRNNVHMCQFELQDPVSKLPMKKPMSFLNNLDGEVSTLCASDAQKTIHIRSSWVVHRVMVVAQSSRKHIPRIFVMSSPRLYSHSSTVE